MVLFNFLGWVVESICIFFVARRPYRLKLWRLYALRWFLRCATIPHIKRWAAWPIRILLQRLQQHTDKWAIEFLPVDRQQEITFALVSIERLVRAYFPYPLVPDRKGIFDELQLRLLRNSAYWGEVQRSDEPFNIRISRVRNVYDMWLEMPDDYCHKMWRHDGWAQLCEDVFDDPMAICWEWDFIRPMLQACWKDAPEIWTKTVERLVAHGRTAEVRVAHGDIRHPIPVTYLLRRAA